ncbi:radical SAM protein [Calothrix sp. PCC 7507]|uniref:radical SAM protein n=1 Tax=Calothrix sp. PCC 7507 TaxID=99598 RepID=UPI00029EE5A5|nr:radical SAM protein [Calothrix sp. PCC 7507]AFY34503.1 Radical SAM domain protein [Calothrix sp. PCC 7507]
MSPRQSVQFVIKTSKHCNLRCRYCYEYAELGNKQAISLKQIEQMFRNIASYYQKLDFPVDIEFIWHGGEPLLQHPNFYWQAFDLQHQIFDHERDRVTNGVQTNLTLLDRERLRLLAEGFDHVGVSIDLFGGLRVYQTGIESQERVLENMDRLTAAGVDFGCITVLTKCNIDRITEIYEFYRSMNISVRILPLFKGAFDNQHDGFEISAYDTLRAYKQLVDLWLDDEEFVFITPIREAIQQVVYHYSPNSPTTFYDKREWESIYLVNTDGEVYSYADAYDHNRSHGNLFTTPLAQVIDNENHWKIVADAERRIEQTCSDCSYFGSCSGYPMAEGSREYYPVDERGALQCIVDRGLLEYIDRRFREIGIIDPHTHTIKLDRLNLSSSSNSALTYA